MNVRTRILVGVLVAIVVVLLVLQVPLLSSVRGAVWTVSLSSIGRVVGLGSLEPDGNLLDELSVLRADNARLRAELEDYRTLRQQLAAPAIDNLRAIPALVQGFPLAPFRTAIRINRGAADGVTLGAPAVVGGSVLIGTVTTLNEHTSEVTLLADPSTALPVRVEGVEGSQGVLHGFAHTSLTLSTVPRDVQFEPGQAVVSIEHELVPAGLTVGTVDVITAEEGETYQEARVTPALPVGDIRAVTILVLP